MTRTIETRGGWGVSALLLTAAVAVAPVSTAAQEPGEREECRCVDARGNEIDGCTCLHTPSLETLRELPWMVGRLLGGDRPRIGITLDPEQPPEDDARGARVVDLLEDGPADEAGLREGDLVVRFDGHDLARSLDPGLEEDFDLDRSIPVQRLLALARRLEPGEEVEVEYLRDGERRATTLEARALDRWRVGPGSAPRPPGAPGVPFRLRGDDLAVTVFPEGRRGLTFLHEDGRFERCPTEGGEAGDGRMVIVGGGCPGGLRLVALGPELAGYFGTDRGVLVADVHAESETGLRPGDVIQGVGTREVDSPERLRRILASYEPEESVPFRIVREGRTLDVQGRLGRSD
jgi:hypothetical protein